MSVRASIIIILGLFLHGTAYSNARMIVKNGDRLKSALKVDPPQYAQVSSSREPLANFPWLVRLQSTYQAEGRTQTVRGYGSVIWLKGRFIVLTASHLSQGQNLTVLRWNPDTQKTVKVRVLNRKARNIDDLEVFRIEPWDGIYPLAINEEVDPTDYDLYLVPGSQRRTRSALDLAGEFYAPVGLATFVPRVHSKVESRKHFYLMGTRIRDWAKTHSQGPGQWLFKNYLVDGFAEVEHEAISYSAFPAGMSGLPIIHKPFFQGGLGFAITYAPEIVGVVSGRSWYYRHGWFSLLSKPKKVALFESLESNDKTDSVQWHVHFIEKDYLLYRSGTYGGFDFSEIISASFERLESASGSRRESGSGDRSDSGSGDRSDSGSGDRSDSGSGDRSDSGSGDRSDSGSGDRSDSGSGTQEGRAQRPFPMLSSGILFSKVGQPKQSVVALRVTVGEKTALMAPNVATVRALKDLKSRSQSSKLHFEVQPVLKGEALFSYLLSHYRKHAKLTTKLNGERQFPLLGHILHEGTKNHGIGTIFIDLKPNSTGGAFVHIELLEDRISFELNNYGAVSSAPKSGFQSTITAKNERGETCFVHLGGLLLVDPQMHRDLFNPKLKLMVACPGKQILAEKHMESYD